MVKRHLPVRPDLDQLRHQAKDLLRSIHSGDTAAVAELKEHHPRGVDPQSAKLADAQLVLARSYGAPSWMRLVQSAKLIDAIWEDDIDALRTLVTTNPHLIREDARVVKSNWGPPMSYAANLGRDRIITMLHGLGATDLATAMNRAALQGKVGTARLLHGLLGKPRPSDGSLSDPAYTLNADGTALLFELGARVHDDAGRRLAPVDVVLESDSRKPAAKHAILEMYAAHGFALPDTPTMALHRGRIDLLDVHLRRDPDVLNRRFTHREIYPAEMGCGDPVNATVGTPLGGTTLLHMCVDYDELEIARWLIERGADVNARSDADADGFGGYTPLFCTVVSQPNFWMNYQGRPQIAPFTELLLAHGADVNVRASIRKRLHPGHGDSTEREYRDVTALAWGRRFHAKVFVSEPAMELIEAVRGAD